MDVKKIAYPAIYTALMVSPIGAAANTKPSESQVETVTVEARHWNETLTDVPASITVIQDIKLTDGLDVLDSRIANVKIEQSSVQKRVVIRGISGIDGGLQDPLGYFVDGVALPMGGNQAPQLFNLEQLEVIKGPQGSLYGRNTESGLLKLTSKDPDWAPSFSASLSSALADGANERAPSHILSVRASNTLINESLAGSVALRLEKTKGPYFNLYDQGNDGGKTDGWTLSSGLQLLASDTTDIDFKSTLEKSKNGKSRMRYSTGRFATDRFTTNYNTPTFDDITTAIQSLRINHAFESVDLVSITGLTHYRRNFQADLDATSLPMPATLLDLNNDMLSQELRLSSAAREDNLRWLAGAYVYRESSDIAFQIGAPRTLRQTRIDQTGVAGFGQLELDMTHKLSMTLGARLERVRQQGQQDISSIKLDNSYSKDIDKTVLLPKLTVSYHLPSNDLLYASLAKGYLPGGYNYNAASDIDSFTYGSESSTNAEIGLKGHMLGGDITFDSSLFHIITKDKQIVDLEPGNVQLISNAAETRVYGVEFSLDVSLSETLSSYATLGAQNAKATSYKRNTPQSGALVEQYLSGHRLPLAANYSYSLGLAYQAPQGFFGQVGLNGSGDYYFDIQNKLKQPAYAKVDAEIGYRFNEFTVSLWAKNIFDAEIISRAVNTPNGVVVEDAAPRYFGLQLSADW